MEMLRIKFEGTLVGGERIVKGVSKSSGAEWEMLGLLVEGDDEKTRVYVSCFGGIKKDVELLMLSGGERVIVEFDVVCKGITKDGEERWFTNLNLVSCERVHGVGLKDIADDAVVVDSVVGSMFDEEGVSDDLPF